MNKPFYSIVIPAYNASGFIKYALNSVKDQAYCDYEVIVINDGSNDTTLQVIKDYFMEFPNIKHKIINQENKGIGSARNRGIEKAEGEFVAFLDADDRWHKGKLLKIKNYLKCNPDVDLICHDEYRVGNGEIQGRNKFGPYKTYKDLLFGGNCISTSATVVRKDKLFEAGLFSENMDFNGVEDYDLWLRLSRISKVAYYHEILSEYYIHSEGITSNVKKHIKNVLNVLNYHFNQWPKKSIYYKYMMRKRKAEVMQVAGKCFIKTGDFDLAQIYLSKSFILNPLCLKTLIALVVYGLNKLFNALRVYVCNRFII